MKKPIRTVALFTALMIAFSCSTAKKSQLDFVITDHYLKLVELNGKPVQPDHYTKEPHLIMMYVSEKMTATGGCNRLFGNYKMSAHNQIRFSELSSTKMACGKMQIENEFIKAIEAAANYSTENGKVVFRDSKGFAVARFEKGVKYVEKRVKR